MKKPYIGIQSILFEDQIVNNFENVLYQINKSGYSCVEFIDNVIPLGHKYIKKLLIENNVFCSGLHVDFSLINDQSILESCIDLLHGVDSENLICSGVLDPNSIDGYIESALILNGVGKLCKSQGISFYYHDHQFDFNELPGGIKGIDILSSNTNPEYVQFVIDIYWVFFGGEDVVKFIKEYSNRAGYFHIKDGFFGKFTELGKGEIDLKQILQAIIKTNPEFLIYEQDFSELQPIESAIISRKFLQSLGY